MDAETPMVTSPTAGSRRDSHNLSFTTGDLADPPSPPLPDKSRRHSAARKRTNEEIYKPVQTPKSSPRSARFHQPQSQPGSPTVLGSQNSLTTTRGLRPSPSMQSPRSLREVPTNFGQSNDLFVQEISEYQQRLEDEFREFERSLNERDPTSDLEVLDWSSLEARYEKEIEPHIEAEQEIMNEFNIRFQQFMLYMQVSNEQESDRAIKRLRTRMALAQNSEQTLATKQDHHNKVLDAFQNAMKLLGNL